MIFKYQNYGNEEAKLELQNFPQEKTTLSFCILNATGHFGKLFRRFDVCFLSLYFHLKCLHGKSTDMSVILRLGHGALRPVVWLHVLYRKIWQLPNVYTAASLHGSRDIPGHDFSRSFPQQYMFHTGKFGRFLMYKGLSSCAWQRRRLLLCLEQKFFRARWIHD